MLHWWPVAYKQRMSVRSPLFNSGCNTRQLISTGLKANKLEMESELELTPFITVLESLHRFTSTFIPSQVTMAQWLLLPSEIWLSIFEIIVQDPNGDRTRDNRPNNSNPITKNGLAQYAAVSKEWQGFFEKTLYRHWTLTQSCLGAFGEIVHRQRCLVEHIHLCIELEAYTCPDCSDFGSIPLKRNNIIAKAAINWLFLILSTWRRHQDVLPGGLVLELSIYSPSDSLHAFKGDMYLHSASFTNNDFQGDRPPVHDLYHGWTNGQRLEPPDMAAISRVFTIMAPKFLDAFRLLKLQMVLLYDGKLVVLFLQELYVKSSQVSQILNTSTTSRGGNSFDSGDIFKMNVSLDFRSHWWSSLTLQAIAILYWLCCRIRWKAS